MRFGRVLRSAAVLTAAPVAIAGLAAAPASAHGTLGNPISRIAACFEEGPENPRSEVCRRLVAENGTQPLYDWNEVNIANAAGRHQEIIPDGELCSAGRDKYSGLNNPGEWRSTEMPSGGEFTFEYSVTAPHRGAIEYYVTTDDWDPATPLTWAELEPEPFAVHQDPVAENGTYSITADLPRKSGQHLIYTIWQRSDSPEAFYTCSDVTFGADGAAPATDAAGDGFEAPASEEGHGADHADHAVEDTADEAGAADAANGTGAEEGTGGAETGTAVEADTAEDELDASPAAAHSAHGGGQAEAALPRTGSAVTGLFAAAIVLMASGAGAIHLARRRRGPAGPTV
ncbi:lytic polysaccharide monooxygenase [Nocardiopsis aegyptia]|uniref:lytic polysaccharide monooxygenase n=1 Tax=Nocardiopsis aegyptia TaxID=220378 RepID=UPI00366B15E2